VPSAALNAAATAGWDNVLMNIKGTVYNDCLKIGGSSGVPISHIWLKGYGGDFAHIECVQGSSVSIGGQGGSSPTIVLENMEFSDSAGKGVISGAWFYPYNLSLVWLRNVYLHDAGDQGIFLNASTCCTLPDPNAAAKNAYNVSIENSRLARAGGSNGPAHNMYIELPNVFNFSYSLSESASIGHTLKTRAWETDINCSKLLVSYNPDAAHIFGGASNIDFSEGWTTSLTNSVLGWGFSAGGNQTMMKWAIDQEISAFVDNSPFSSFVYTANGNLWINDANGFASQFGPHNFHPNWDPTVNQPSSASTNETFVNLGSFALGKNPYFLPYSGDPRQLPLRQNSHAYIGSGNPSGGANLGDLFITPGNPPGIVFHVIQSGTTAASEPNAYGTATDLATSAFPAPSHGTTIIDGTATVQAEPASFFFPVTGVSMPATRADAGLPALAGYRGYGDDAARFPIPTACGSRPVGNVAIP